MARVYTSNATSGRSALVSQAAAISFTALIAFVVFTHLPHPLPLFGWHPLTQSLGLILLVQAILTLQPTSGSQPTAKARASTLHQYLLALIVIPLFTAGASIMYHLHDQPGTQHYISWHGTFGAALVPVAWIQAAVGAAVTWGNGVLVGGPNKGRALWKYHRGSGYVVITLFVLTFLLAIWETTWAQNNFLVIQQLLASSLLVVLIGAIAVRINTSKLPKL